MVTRAAVQSGVGVAALCAAIAIPGPAHGSDVLERMEAEVGAIVKASRGAVVSIEDDRPRTAAGYFNVGRVLADAHAEVEKSLREETAKLDRVREKTGARPEERAITAKRREDIRQKMRDAQKLSHDLVKRVVPFVSNDAPKAGTGFSIGEDYVVTTADVLDGMENPVVVTESGVRIKAIVAGLDPDLNIGLLKMAARADIPSLKWGDSARVGVGSFGISISNQSGQMNSVALNLVAGLRGGGTNAGRRFYPTLIQIAGTVGAGSSGAPLINSRGEVVGMMAAVQAGDWAENRLRLSPDMPAAPARPALMNDPRSGAIGGVEHNVAVRVTAPAQSPPSGDSPEDVSPQAVLTFLRPPVTSAGFAIPSNDVRSVIEMLKSGKPAIRGWLGVITNSHTVYVTEGDFSRPVCVVKIEEVVAGSPAARAGVESGDVLVSIGDKSIGCANEVRSVSLGLRPGDLVEVVVKRAGEVKKFRLRIDARPEADLRRMPKREIRKTGFYLPESRLRLTNVELPDQWVAAASPLSRALEVR